MDNEQESLIQASDSSRDGLTIESSQDDISAGFAGSLTDQLTETLNAANAPPASSDSSHALTVAGSPANDSSVSLTDDDLAPVFAQAKRIWIASGLSADQADLLDTVRVNILDLAGGRLGETNGSVISLDATAAGHGWFVDPSPADNSEFEIILSASRLSADNASDAFGRIDLLTVLLHEMGHVLGLSHSADLSVMNEALGNGERVLVGNGGALVAGGSVSAALTEEALGTLASDTTDVDPVTFRLFDDNGNSAIDVEVASKSPSGQRYSDGIGVIDGTRGAPATSCRSIRHDVVDFWCELWKCCSQRFRCHRIQRHRQPDRCGRQRRHICFRVGRFAERFD